MVGLALVAGLPHIGEPREGVPSADTAYRGNNTASGDVMASWQTHS